MYTTDFYTLCKRNIIKTHLNTFYKVTLHHNKGYISHILVAPLPAKPDEFMARLDVEVDRPAASESVAMLGMKACVGTAKLQAAKDSCDVSSVLI